MHGTWVNDKKIPSRCDVAISTDDVLTFGAEVTRGSGKPSAIAAGISHQLHGCCCAVVTDFPHQKPLLRSGHALSANGLICGGYPLLFRKNNSC